MKQLILMFLLFTTIQIRTMDFVAPEKVAAWMLISVSSYVVYHYFFKKSEIPTIVSSPLDIRKMWLDFPHNKQDEHGNTFWHQLAQKSAQFTDWSQVNEEIGAFMSENKKWLPNPFIENKRGRTAHKEAELIFEKCGNPVTAGVVLHLHRMEEKYLDSVAWQKSRDSMNSAQYQEHPSKNVTEKGSAS
jgi:hypothetical protein